MINKISKIFSVIYKRAVTVLNYFNADLYMDVYQRYLKNLGINLSLDKSGYIDPTCQFDGSNYSLITIGERTTISKEVLILTHDYSLNRGMEIKQVKGKYMFSKPVKIGSNCFIGARSTLLPGTNIGDDCIIGACSVVKGNIPNGSVVSGNPARVVCSTTDWIERHIEKQDFIKLY